MRRILLDQGLAQHAEAILSQEGVDAVHVSEIGTERANDSEILDVARNDSRVCVTLDHDFHAHLALSRQGVLRLRVQGLDAMGQAALIKSICLQCESALLEGAAISGDGESIRLRRLPLR